ncbi:MAG: Nicotinate-nucleotide adenylyltransferase [Candidatus Anoxychlamydiales bacterium]|nr:Nicotinate-nucleotide adenylyltransferase [Candidatus Anoxychlamydiales bacterium]NGX36663.1 Nicotinate-nucleotide adenylyltransferase [Candidatus Anoxychlamydiales bacterium]
MKNIGFFGGSFDPIQFGHINLAIQIKEILKLDKILFCPTNISPFKTKNPPKARAQDRLKMLKLAIEGLNGFEICEIEIQREDISYTIDTLNEIKSMGNIRLIVTDDALNSFHLWKEYKQILKIATLLVGVRLSDINHFKSENFTLSSKNFIKTKIFEISSTAIRERLKNKMYCYHLLPKEVLDYIYKRKIYL